MIRSNKRYAAQLGFEMEHCARHRKRSRLSPSRLVSKSDPQGLKGQQYSPGRENEPKNIGFRIGTNIPRNNGLSKHSKSSWNTVSTEIRQPQISVSMRIKSIIFLCFRGYMSPEYAMGGIFSEKSDVFSFGVLLLEIISGKKNTTFPYLYKQLSLITYVSSNLS